MKLHVFAKKNPDQILLRIILSERAFFCKQLSPGILLQFSQKLFVFPILCINMHIFKPRTRFTTSNEVVYLNPDLHWAWSDYLHAVLGWRPGRLLFSSPVIFSWWLSVGPFSGSKQQRVCLVCFWHGSNLIQGQFF